jgi:hypothetical protein
MGGSEMKVADIVLGIVATLPTPRSADRAFLAVLKNQVRAQVQARAASVTQKPITFTDLLMLC